MSYQPEEPSATGSMEPKPDRPRENYFVRHWRGELSLAVSYWVNGLLASMAAYAIVYTMASLILQMPTDYSPAIFWISAWSAIFLITMWQVVGIWRSADRAKSFGGLAKFMVILGLLSTVSRFLNEGVPAIKESLNRVPLEKWSMKIARNGTELELSGGIGNGFTNDLTHILDVDSGIRLVHVNLEYGGLLTEAHSAGALIHSRQLNTYVSSYCQSACTIVFLGGRERYLGKDGKLGFHSPSFPGVADVSSTVSDERQYLKAVGLSDSFINQVFSTPKDKMWFPDNEQLLREGVITSVVSGDEFALSGGPQNFSHSDFEKGLLEVRVYRVVKDKEPAIYQKILNTLEDGIREGKAMDDMRPLTVSFIGELVKKYTPYADERSLEHLANVIIGEINDLAAAPEPVCFKYLVSGEDINEATRFLSKATVHDELDAMADVIESGNLARTMPTEGQKDAALKALVQTLDRATLKEITATNDHAYVGSYTTCLAVKTMYQKALSMPEPYRETALRVLLDRR